jgi:hypothetical protein
MTPPIGNDEEMVVLRDKEGAYYLLRRRVLDMYARVPDQHRAALEQHLRTDTDVAGFALDLGPATPGPEFTFVGFVVRGLPPGITFPDS